MTYTGMTPNDVSLAAWYFGAWPVGGALSFQREAFGLFGDQGRVTAGSLMRGHAGPAGRVGFGPIRAEVVAGFGYAQLPWFGLPPEQGSVTPTLVPATRMSALLAARVMLDLGPLTVEAAGEYPVPLAVSAPGRSGGRSTGFAGGGSLGYQLGRSGDFGYGVMANYQYVNDSFTSGDGSESSNQTLQRIGLAFELKWLPPVGPPPPRFGGVVVSVLDEATGAALPEASVVLVHEGAERALVPDVSGRLSASELRPGAVAARVTAGGYLPGEASGQVVAGQELTLTVRAKKEPPKVGSVVVTVTDKETSAPLAQCAVVVREQELMTDATGSVTVADLPPGPVEIKVALKGYRPGAEVGSVVAGKSATVAVTLVKEAKRLPATITGHVRSTRGGKPVPAVLEIPQAKIKTKANNGGAFTFKLEGGTYTVNISAPGYIAQSKSVTVKDGDQAIFNVDLHPR